MAVKHARLTASLIAAAALGFGVVEIGADLQARSELRRVFAAHPDLTIRSMRVEPFGGRLVLEGLAAGRDPAAHVTIGRLTLAARPFGFGLVSSARAESALDSAIKALGSKPEESKPETPPPADDVKGSAGASQSPGAAPTPPPPQTGATVPATSIPGTATVENVVITSGATTYRIKRIDLTGTPLSNAELANLLDAKSGEDAESRLRKVNATAIVIPEILVDDPTAGSEGHLTVSQVALAGVVAGKATAVSIGGVTFQGKTGEDTTSGSIGLTQAFGVDYPQAAHVFGTVRRSESEPIRPLYDSVTVNGVKVTNAKGDTATLASLKETGVRGRPLKTDVLVLQRTGRPKLSKAEEVSLVADLVHSFEVDSIEANDFGVQGADPKEPFEVGLARFGFRGLAKGKLGGLSFRGIRFEMPTVRVGLASIEAGSFDLPQTDAPPVPAFAGKLDADGLDVDVLPSKAKGDERVRFKLGHLGFQGDGAPGDLPTSFNLALNNMAFDLPANPGQARPLVDMGYRHLDLSAALTTHYDAGRQELTVRDLMLKGIDMGSLSLGLRFLNVTKGVMSTKPEVQKASLLAVLVKEVTLDVVNEGLVDRAIAWKAKQDGMSVDAEKASIIEFFNKSLPAQFSSANVKIIGSAVAKFVSAPRKLHVGVASQSGLGAGSMALLNDPNLLLDTLEVNASAD